MDEDAANKPEGMNGKINEDEVHGEEGANEPGFDPMEDARAQALRAPHLEPERLDIDAGFFDATDKARAQAMMAHFPDLIPAPLEENEDGVHGEEGANKQEGMNEPEGMNEDETNEERSLSCTTSCKRGQTRRNPMY